ncbi:MAG: 2-dehydro-3-deoxygalactonokinase [Deltaproteobacteria bacterium]|nr:2-dehydro-3-deoxygalactonokinase [Deltaproteobacteria bacterium]
MKEKTIIAIDGGTTHTRLWVVEVQTRAVLYSDRAAIGARDGTNPQGRARIATEIAGLIRRAIVDCETRGIVVGSAFAAGMIGSPQGLCEVSHVPAPAGLAELAAGMVRVDLPGELQLSIVPGVRFGPQRVTVAEVGETDVVRGEEILCLGLHSEGLLPDNGTIVNLGSHWKRLGLDGDARLAQSISCLSGEFLQAVSQHTILASALPDTLDGELDPEMVDAGAEVAARQGLGRALYCVRLMSVRAGADAQACRAFLVGAALACDLPVLLPQVAGRVQVVGRLALAEAFVRLGRTRGVDCQVLSAEKAENAFRAGLLAIALADGDRGLPKTH